jgi:S-DNA-T family DNA segregation ATPase FtsK/SpoIIIE
VRHVHWLTSPGLWFVAVVAVWLTGGAVLRGRSPVWHWYLVGYPVTWCRITWSWRALAIERGLSISRTSGHVMVGDLVVRGQDLRPVVPKILISRPSRRGLTVRVRLLPGQTPELYAQASEAMMHAWRVEGVRVTSRTRGVVLIEALTVDPLAGVIERAADHSPVLATGSADRPVMALLAGITERGSSWIINLRLVAHWLIVGATLSGKSTLVHALMVRLAYQNVALVGIDLKGGLELGIYAPRLSGLATTREEAAGLLAAVLEEIHERMELCRLGRVRAVWDLPEPPPPLVVLIDEIAEIYLLTNPKDREEQGVRDRAITALLRIAQLGGSLDVHVIASGQRFGADLGQGATALRAQLGGRVCLHVNDPETATMVLGDVWPEAVAVAQLITAEERGVAVTADGSGSWVRARATLTSPEEAERVAAETARLTPVIAGIDRPWTGRGGDVA